MIEPILPDRKVVASFYTQGGLANTNIRLQLSGTQTPLILRVFTRDPSQAEKECRIYQRINGIVPSPKIYYYSPTNPVSGHPYSILQLVEGDRLETLVEGLDPSWSVEVGRGVGASLAAIHSVTFDREGFLDEQLNVKTPIGSGSSGLVDFSMSCLEQDLVSQRLGPDLRKQLSRFIKRESMIFEVWKSSACLVHADFGGSNILVKKFDSGWRVTAVLDWEFALSANPFMDFGNLLRDPLGSVEGFEQAVQEGYFSAGGTLPADWRKMSKLSDITAWLDFLTRPTANDRLVADAISVIEKTMAEWHQPR
ncbi:MAG: aminoglycoside phosphotransferase family protein [Candidatus Melainabacteria bacterium]|nr:aminoglycoside phosphotransferase family protein [Candidatus Melainabacteria bacterium]